ncbi:HAD domain-containing protein [Noviherbaspirillum denitrificans]|uniref:Uncharacterized protein n=1 Tax=Noviherbaspirillum denitrificans TaxID=1968433 RepID=A0A254TBQ4_9BURK|nr:HAD domain-containing protein [Noviherbaspirillum denitrificans]OWW19587.1 hypothetical protein AYR66_08720 [Noviherbaspirillum denitrificans]
MKINAARLDPAPLPGAALSRYRVRFAHRHPTMLLFLGFDGVLHPADGERTLFQHRDALEALLRAHAHVDVVITSSWREVFDTDTLREDYFSRDIQPRIIDVTPLIPGAMRWQEVQAYLEETRHAGPYLVVDDDASEFPPGWEHLLLCAPETGLDAGKLEELAARIRR